MPRKPGDIDKFRALQGLTGRAIARLGKIIDSGTDSDAIAASRIVLDRTAPVPKQSAADIAKAAAMGAVAGGAAHLAALEQRARQRLAEPSDTAQTVQTLGPPVFAPLVRVQKDQSNQ